MIGKKPVLCITIFANWSVAPLPGHTYDYGTLSEIAQSQLLIRGCIIDIYVELESCTKKVDPKVLLKAADERVDYNKISMTNRLREAIIDMKEQEKNNKLDKPIGQIPKGPIPPPPELPEPPDWQIDKHFSIF